MRKGISTVIATLLMLVMTIGLAGVAYTYISNTIVTTAARQIDLIDATCKAGTAYYVTVRNLDGSITIPTSGILVRVDDSPVVTIAWDTGTLAASGGVGTATVTNPAGGTAGTAHRVKVIGPSNAEQVPAYC